ncbi:hypothetical protein AFERRI_30238 [Acidithiobacillus ferrivorans]|uniref:Uncharacterized protein n=1 Tax=Acidithiobacillus ferrivorans TaxID=160808 RepID=A0A060ULS3_9PROT|nr:hypothetical protein AFERRI_30238 [Acidithiobacillus ferrivorans]
MPRCPILQSLKTKPSPMRRTLYSAHMNTLVLDRGSLHVFVRVQTAHMSWQADKSIDNLHGQLSHLPEKANYPF